MAIGFVIWSLGGLGVGWLVGTLDSRNRYGLLGYLIVALVGALGSGYLAQCLFHSHVDPFGLATLWIGCLGALVAVLLLGIATARPSQRSKKA